ncbi:MAG: type II and III secretion system protein family protein [Caulobacteraceae bacterium]|nr:type II and III secretion system protein family protein [Caulobacteraceae bacterium]
MKRLMNPIQRPGRLASILASAGIMALAPIAASAQTQSFAPPADAGGRSTVQVGSTPRLINLPRGSSMAIDLPTDAHDAIVSNPAVAEALTHSSRRYTIIGVAPGQTDAVFLDAAGRTILSLRIRVDAGVYALQDTIDRVAPGSQAHAEALNDSIVLTGMVTSPGEADRIVQLARAFVSAPEKVINLMTVAGSDQVTLKVRVVEVQRSAVKQLGVNLRAIVANAADGLSFTQSPTFGVNGNILGGGTINYTDGTTDGLTAALGAFERAGLVRTLAEPNLTSINGEGASFLAGGEFPVPTSRDRDGNVSVEYKPYGVRLSFRPVVLSGGRISMQISVEVSELTSEGAFTLGSGTATALTLQGLQVRRVENTVEMPSGGAMMIAGLLKENSRQTIDSLPGAGGIPVLGALFRSRDFTSGETELVVIAEPYIVTPTSPGRMQTPADGLRIANDIQTTLFGQLNEAYGTPAPTATAGAGWQGPVGYVIE